MSSTRLTVIQAAKRVGIDRNKIYRMIENGTLSKISEGNKVFIDLSELNRVFANQTSSIASNISRNVSENEQIERAIKIARLEAELRAEQEKNQLLERNLNSVEKSLDDLRKLITDQRPKGFWRRIFG
jgi:excisionase family DNA binding protein